MVLDFETSVIRALRPRFDLLLKPVEYSSSVEKLDANETLKYPIEYDLDEENKPTIGELAHITGIPANCEDEIIDNDVTIARNQDILLFNENEGNEGFEQLKNFVRQYPRIPPLLFATVFSLFAAMGGFLGGYDTGITSGAMVYIKDQYKFDDIKTEVIVSGVVGGAIFGSLISGNLSDKYGRKFVSTVSAVTYMLGGLVMSTAQGFVSLLLGRLVTGLAVGCGSIAPVYIGEVVPSEYRGAFVNSNAFLIAMGQFVSYLIAYSLSDVDQNILDSSGKHASPVSEKGNWRLMLGLTTIPPFIQLLLVPFMPQSPRFLNSKNMIVDAAKSLLLVYPKNRSKDEIVRRVMNIKAHTKITDNEKGRQASYLSLLKKPHFRKLVLITSTLQALQQLSGINTVMYYSAFILRMAGFPSKSSSILFSTIIGLANSLGSLFSMYTINRFRRRPLLLITLVGVFVALLNLALTFRKADIGPDGLPKTPPANGEIIDRSSYLALANVVIYVIFYSLGLGCVPWNLVSEIFPMEARSRGAAFAVATNWIFNFFVSITFLTLVKKISASGTFFLYSIFMALGFVFIYFLVPETKNKSLEADVDATNARNSTSNI